MKTDVVFTVIAGLMTAATAFSFIGGNFIAAGLTLIAVIISLAVVWNVTK